VKVLWLLGNFEMVKYNVTANKQSLSEKVQWRERNSSDHLIRFQNLLQFNEIRTPTFVQDYKQYSWLKLGRIFRNLTIEQ